MEDLCSTMDGISTIQKIGGDWEKSAQKTQFKKIIVMVNATTSSPLGTLLLILAAARCCTGFCSRTVGPRTSSSSPISHGALPPLGRSICQNRSSSSSSSRRLLRMMNANDDDINDDDEISTEEGGGGRKKNDEEKKERVGLTWEEIMSDPEMRKIEYDSSINRKNAMLLPQRISAAITTLGWIFVICGFVLNQLGYAYVKDPAGGIRIGSLDERDFQVEVVKEGRMMRRTEEEEDAKKRGEGKGNPTLSIISHHEDSNSRILFGWIERET